MIAEKISKKENYESMITLDSFNYSENVEQEEKNKSSTFECANLCWYLCIFLSILFMILLSVGIVFAVHQIYQNPNRKFFYLHLWA